MKISFITPTYNDAESIVETMESVVNQTYKNWEMIIVDDGSTDNTKQVVENYIKERNVDKIKYVYQENGDQLNAIITGTKHITGDYVFLIHSDDLLTSENLLQQAVDYLKNNPQYDSITADLTIIDVDSNITGTQKVRDYKINKKIPAILLLWLGRNLFVDFGFHKKEVFMNQIFDSYTTWNMPFWLYYQNEPKMLNVKKVDFPLLKYRVHANNYMNNFKGKLNVINGELRTAARLMYYYHIPCYTIQYFLYRVFNKLKLGNIFTPIYFSKPQKNKGNVIEFIIKKRFRQEEYKENTFLNSLINFYKKDANRAIIIDKIPDGLKIYKGKDNNDFNKKILNNTLEEFYTNFLNEMSTGFNKIELKKKEDKEKLIDILKFLCIYNFVEIQEA